MTPSLQYTNIGFFCPDITLLHKDAVGGLLSEAKILSRRIETASFPSGQGKNVKKGC